ncbi:hypothetical protein BGZ46_006115 [Entomortierella lignicola]|nr:hypothetical protein BGZ46_006115 [Entomortierella lignicola]
MSRLPDPPSEFDIGDDIASFDSVDLRAELDAIKEEDLQTATLILSEQLQDACWVDLLLVTDPFYLTHRKTEVGYIPKVFFLDENVYQDWISRDRENHFFHWRLRSPRKDLVATSDYEWSETWQYHRAGNPRCRPKKSAIAQCLKEERKDLPAELGNTLDQDEAAHNNDLSDNVDSKIMSCPVPVNPVKVVKPRNVYKDPQHRVRLLFMSIK